MAALRELSEHELRQVRGQAVDELLSAVRHLGDVARLIARVDRRLEQLAGQPAVARRQELASAR